MQPHTMCQRLIDASFQDEFPMEWVKLHATYAAWRGKHRRMARASRRRNRGQ